MKYLDKSQKPLSNIENQQKFVWDDTQAFLSIARHGTLTKASRSLGLSLATLARKLERLENCLGVPLFIRLQSGYQLTKDGSELVSKAEIVEQAALSLLKTSSNHHVELAGKVRIATADNLANEIIIPELSNLLADFPQLSIELTTNTQLANVHQCDADLAVRMVRPDKGNVTFRRFGTVGFGLYSNNPISCGNYITWDDPQQRLPGTRWMQERLQGCAPKLSVTTIASMVSATKAGIGMSILPHFIANRAKLTCIDYDIGISQDIYLVIQSDLANSSRIRVVADYLTKIMNKYSHFLESGEELL